MYLKEVTPQGENAAIPLGRPNTTNFNGWCQTTCGNKPKKKKPKNITSDKINNHNSDVQSTELQLVWCIPSKVASPYNITPTKQKIQIIKALSP